MTKWRGFEPNAVTVVSRGGAEQWPTGRGDGTEKASESRAVAKTSKSKFISDFILQLLSV